MAAKGSQTRRPRRSFGRLALLPSGRWRARYTGPDGELHNAPRTFEAKIDAEGWIASERRLIDLDAWTPPDERQARAQALTVTVAEYCKTVIDRRVRKQPDPLRPGSAAVYRSLVKTRIVPYIGHIGLGAVTPATIAEWVDSMAADYPDTKSRNSQAYRLFASVCTDAVEDELLPVSPCRSPKAGRKPKPARKSLLSTDEYTALVAALPERYRLMAELMAGCALRLGEVTELRKKDVRVGRAGDAVAATVTVARAVSWTTGEAAHVGPPKSEAGRRTVTVPPHVAALLVDHLDTLPSRDALLFTNVTGAQIRPTSFRKVFERAATAAGRPDVSPHMLRHFGAVQAALVGATLRELMDRLGHSTATTALIYQHTAAGRDAEIAARISKLSGGDR
ncbi:site-specific integrase [Dietzia sp. SLG310A2-38A2]|uniref:tyrosine-type recombinase/integrase n=1 Tax=Dietzia sp. SLG310A2-38A2 TaxID=1630643 RepID=UPI0015FB5B17|nr:site-specific integrase [Dietzia sp. SLG310A2-38A2]MBB1030509.1 site-specific integrase [Dietzia sp. SLG310A2-38A2]